MRILMITTDHLMIDRRILQQAGTLRDAGHEVTILAGFECPQPASFEVNGIPVKRYTYDWSDTRVERIIARLPTMPGTLRSKTWLAIRHAVTTATRISSFEDYVIRRVLSFKFDVIHCHDFPLLAVAVEVARLRRTPVVYDAHELYHAQVQFPKKVRRAYKARERRLIRHVDLATTVNPFIADLMARDYRISTPQVILNAAEPSPCDERPGLRERLGLPPNDRILLYQGWISPERGIDVLIRAARDFPADVRLVLIGYGSHESDLRKLSLDQGTDDGRVIFLGKVESEELSPLTRSADLGVIPYSGVDLNHYFCSPNKLFELAAAGVPFISNDLPYLRFISERYGFGVLTDLQSPAEAAHGILSTIQDSERLQALRAAARRAAAELNWAVEGKKLLKLYDQHISPKVRN